MDIPQGGFSFSLLPDRIGSRNVGFWNTILKQFFGSFLMLRKCLLTRREEAKILLSYDII